jgi:hypothetical protein
MTPLRFNFEQIHSGTGPQTDYTLQFVPDVFKPSLRRGYPMPISPRRIMPDMLLMPALKISNPIEAFVQMIIHNFAGNTDRLCS